MTDGADSSIMLDPNDDFESVLIDMVKMNRRKRADYAGDDNVIANFEFNASLMWLHDYGPFEDAFTMVTRKIGRIQNLMGKGLKPQNEPLNDSLIDLAVYSVLMILCFERQYAQVHVDKVSDDYDYANGDPCGD